MSDALSDGSLLAELREGAEAMALLAGNDETFRAAVDAFRAQDGESLQLLLARHDLAERCEVVCHWLRSKECVLLCLGLSGPPPIEAEPPEVREFAEAVARVTADEELVEAVATAVEERDPDAWRALIEKGRLEAFSHLLCHWACTIRYRLVCDVICQPSAVRALPLEPALRAAGQAIGRLVADEKAFSGAVEAVQAGDCDLLRNRIADAGLAADGQLICEWFCSWRCLLLCLALCREFPVELAGSPVEEMRGFALAGGRLAAEQGALERLSGAVLRSDIETVRELVEKLEFRPYCLQFCHWVCFLRCQLFCICVSPPATEAFFTHIGGLAYATDVASAFGGNGLTVGGHRAFFDTLSLNGSMSMVNGAPLVEYRFETIATGADGTTVGTWTAIPGAQIGPVKIGSFMRSWPLPPFFQEIDVWVNYPGGSTPTIYSITPTADGWIPVPPMVPVAPMVTGTGWEFIPSNDLLNLDTTKTMPSSVVTISEAGVVAGSAPSATLETDVYFGIRMRLRNVGDTSDGTDGGTCEHIAINNSSYNDVSHHPYWTGGLWSPTPATDFEIGLCSVGITELAENPCSDLNTSLTVTFTAAHSNLGSVTVTMEGPGGPYAFDLSPSAAETAGESWYGTATPNGWTFADLTPCAYLVKLSIVVLLTNGDSDITPEPYVDYIAYCKGS